MKRVGILLALAVVVGYGVIAQASLITKVSAQDDGDGVMKCPLVEQIYPIEAPVPEGDLAVVGNHYWPETVSEPTGHVLVDIETTDAVDPILRLRNTIDNDTGVAWASYTVDVSLAKKTDNTPLGFTISNLLLNAPGTGWTASILQPSLSNGYVGSVLFSGVPAIPAGGAIDFQYNVTFSGATKYVLTQAMTPEPVPEPSSLLLLLCGGLSLVALRHKLARG